MTSALGTVARWVPRHGAARLVLGRAAKTGDQRARMIIDSAATADPYEGYEAIRRRGRLVPGRLLATTVDHEIADLALRSEAFGTPASPERLPRPLRAVYRWFPDELAMGPVDPPSMLAVDPPDHTRYRRLVSKAFTARAIEALRKRTEELTAQLLDELDKGPARTDLVDRLAAPLPVTVIAGVLGVPLDRRDDLLRWGHAAAPSLDLGLRFSEYRRVERGIRAFNRYMSGHLDRLAAHPGEDILSKLVSQQGAEQLTRAELLATASLLLGAGFETTVNLIGNGVVLLLENPEQLAALRADPKLWPNAVEEILRYDSPVQNTARRCLRDTELAGQPVAEGTILGILIGGVNRDPNVFAEPATFDVRRKNAREHLAFSAGVHFCLGAALARMEAEIALRQLFERFPDLRLAGVPERRPTRTLRGYRSLPVMLR